MILTPLRGLLAVALVLALWGLVHAVLGKKIRYSIDQYYTLLLPLLAATLGGVPVFFLSAKPLLAKGCRQAWTQHYARRCGLALVAIIALIITSLFSGDIQATLNAIPQSPLPTLWLWLAIQSSVLVITHWLQTKLPSHRQGLLASASMVLYLGLLLIGIDILTRILLPLIGFLIVFFGQLFL